MTIPFESSVTLTRSSAGAYVSGTWTPGATSTVSVNATVLPAKAHDVVARFGGTYTKGMAVILSHSAIIAADEEDQVVGDKFTFEGDTFEIVAVDRYTQVIPHYHGWAKIADDKEP